MKILVKWQYFKTKRLYSIRMRVSHDQVSAMFLDVIIMNRALSNAVISVKSFVVMMIAQYIIRQLVGKFQVLNSSKLEKILELVHLHGISSVSSVLESVEIELSGRGTQSKILEGVVRPLSLSKREDSSPEFDEPLPIL